MSLLGLLGKSTGDPGKDAALDRGLLQMGLAMMASRSPSVGQAFGQGGLVGIQGYNNALDEQFQQDQRGQAKKMWAEQNRQLGQQATIRDTSKQFYRSPEQNALAGGGGPTVENAQKIGSSPASFDSAGFVRALYGAGIDPMEVKRLETMFSKDRSPIAVKQGETLLDNQTFKPIYTSANPDKPTNDIQEFNFAQARGEVPAGMSFTEWMRGNKRAGATNVQVKTDVKTGESLAGQVGPMMKDSAGAAEAAVKQVDAAQRITKAIDSNKLFVGPGANIKLKGTQILDMLGMAGKNDAEKLENTRQAIRGLAELTLQGRQQMKGQGAITESEGRLAEKAMSGDIADLTAGELRQLAAASERAARFNYAQHERRMSGVRGRKEFDVVSPFYEAPQMLPELTSKPTQPSGQDLLNQADAIIGVGR